MRRLHARALLYVIGAGVLVLALSAQTCVTTQGDGGTVTLPNIGGQVCYNVEFDGGNGNGRVCMELAPGENGPEVVGPVMTAPE